MWVTKLMISQVKKKDLLLQNDQIWPKIGIFGQFGPGHAGFFGPLLVGRLVVGARGLYLARHLFTLFAHYVQCPTKNQCEQGAWVGFPLCGSIAGLFGALLVGWLVVVARGLYLARHLFTLLAQSKGYPLHSTIHHPVRHLLQSPIKPYSLKTPKTPNTP